MLRSTNNGASFTANLVDTVELAPDCTAAGCPADYYPGHTAITADSAGTLVLLYDGATVSKGNETDLVPSLDGRRGDVVGASGAVDGR